MTGWEIAVLVLAAVAAAASAAALAVSVYASKKGGADVDTLNDVRKMIDESADDREEAILREITSAKDFISKTQSDANNVVAAAIDSNLKGNRESINMLIGDVRENMKQLREEQTRNMDKIDTGMEKDFDKLREDQRALSARRKEFCKNWVAQAKAEGKKHWLRVLAREEFSRILAAEANSTDTAADDTAKTDTDKNE